MSRTQRLTMLGLAVAVAIVAFVVLRSGGDESEPADTASAPTATATATPQDDGGSEQPEETATPAPTPRPRPQLPVLRSGTVRELEFKQGDTVRFAARANEDEEVHVHGYDISKAAPAGETIRMSFKAELTGIFEIEFEHAGEPIAELKVEP